MLVMTREYIQSHNARVLQFQNYLEDKTSDLEKGQVYNGFTYAEIKWSFNREDFPPTLEEFISSITVEEKKLLEDTSFIKKNIPYLPPVSLV